MDFSENYSLVVNNVTFCALLLMVQHFEYLAKIVDMETAFLYRDLEEEIYMECPQGMSDIKKDDCIISNMSNSNDNASPVAYKELLCVIKYVLDTKNLGLKIEPMRNSYNPWEIICLSNSDYAGDPVSRQSISGFILYVQGVLVSWQWRSQKSVSLSSSEAEYIALSETERCHIYGKQYYNHISH